MRCALNGDQSLWIIFWFECFIFLECASKTLVLNCSYFLILFSILCPCESPETPFAEEVYTVQEAVGWDSCFLVH
jgi:hypothetical protein